MRARNSRNNNSSGPGEISRDYILMFEDPFNHIILYGCAAVVILIIVVAVVTLT